MKQKTALDILKMGHNVFLTGPAGSGKTFLLNQYIQYLKSKNIGVDISKYAINIAKKRIMSAKLQVADAEKILPFQEDTFDVAICNDVLEHLESHQMALEKIKKVLKDKGILYINTPNLNSFRKKVLSFADKQEHHISLFSHKDLHDLLEKVEFKIKEHYTYINFTYFFFIKFNSNIGAEPAFICTK